MVESEQMDACSNGWRRYVFKMSKLANFFVPGCLDNIRNSCILHYYGIPKESRLRKQYVHQIRNKTLNIGSDNTKNSLGPF